MNEWNTEFCAIRCVSLPFNLTAVGDGNSSRLHRVPEPDSLLPDAVILSDKLCNETRSPAKEYFK